MAKAVKILLFSLVILIIGFTLVWVYNWKNPSINFSFDSEKSFKKFVDKNLLSNPKAEKESLDSIRGRLKINFLKNSETYNPPFPMINIEFLPLNGLKHNAWIHVLHTDSKEEKYKIFIDAENQDISPFYLTSEIRDNFFDAPYLWNIFKRPFDYWEGHVYAVYVDYINNKITCLGGIKWGYKFKYFFSTKPDMILPKALGEDDWRKDWIFFHKNHPLFTTENFVSS